MSAFFSAEREDRPTLQREVSRKCAEDDDDAERVHSVVR